MSYKITHFLNSLTARGLTCPQGSHKVCDCTPRVSGRDWRPVLGIDIVHKDIGRTESQETSTEAAIDEETARANAAS